MLLGTACAALLLWVTAVSRQMPPPGSGAVKEGESVPDLNLECGTESCQHASEPIGLRAGCFFRVAMLRTLGQEGPDDFGSGWGFL